MKGAASSIQQVCVCVCVCVCKGQLVQALSLAAEAPQVQETMHHVYERTYIREQTPDAYTPPLSNWVNREMPKLRVELETSGITVSPSTFSYR